MSTAKRRPDDIRLEDFAREVSMPSATVKKLCAPDYALNGVWFYHAETVTAAKAGMCAGVSAVFGGKRQGADDANP